MEVSDIWNMKFGALWDPNKVVLQQPNVRQLEYKKHSLEEHGAQHMELVAPVDDLDDLAQSVGYDVRESVAKMFSPKPEDFAKDDDVEAINGWMKDNQIPWIGMNNNDQYSSRGNSSHIFPLHKPNRDDIQDMLSTSNDFWTVYPANSSWFHVPVKELGCGGDSFDKECPKCIDRVTKVFGEGYDRNQRHAALWDPSKIKSLPILVRTDVPDTIPLHWEDREDGSKFMCDDLSHHHWTTADSHEDCDDEQHKDLSGERYKQHGILINTPREGYPNGYNDFFTNSAYIAPRGYGEEVKKEIAGPYVDNLYVSLFNNSDTNTKEHMRSWMKEKNVPWIGLLAPNGQSSTLYLLEQNLSNNLEKDDFQSLMSSMPPDTRLTVSNQGQISTQHKEDHGEEKSNECSTCLDNLYSLYTDMKRDFNGTE